MTRDEAIRQCGAYLDGQLSPIQERELEAYLRKDGETARYFSEQKCFHRLVKKCSQRVERPPDFENRLCARLDCCPCARMGWVGKSVVAVIVLLVVAMGIYFLLRK
jgi:anti-sigma factor RsiW